MKSFLLLSLVLTTKAYSFEITGEWSNCEITKDDVTVYTTVLTKNYRHEIVVFSKGKVCNDIYTKAYAAIKSVSKITIKDDYIIHQRISNSFIGFDDRRKDIMGNSHKCSLDYWFKTLDSKCGLDGDFNPEMQEALLEDVNRIDGKKYKISIKNNYLYEDFFSDKGLAPSSIFNQSLFK
jgi:hypothetical protein